MAPGLSRVAAYDPGLLIDLAAAYYIEEYDEDDGIGWSDGSPVEADADEFRHTLSITGEPRDYVGDGHVWLWYRGTGVGPYPCMSALQALEFVTEEHIRAGCHRSS